MHKGMVSGLTSSAIRTQAITNANAGFIFNTPTFRRVATISQSGGLTLLSSNASHIIGGASSSFSSPVTFNNTVTFNSTVTCSQQLRIINSSSFIDVQLGLGSSSNWGYLNVTTGIRTVSGFWPGSRDSGTVYTSEICADGLNNVVAIRNLTNAQSFRVYRTTNGQNNDGNGPYFSSHFERIELTWSGTEAVVGTASGGTGFARGLILRTNSIDRISIAAGGNITIADGLAVNVGSTSGTQFGTSSGQKIGFWGATPIIRPAEVSVPSGGAIVDSECRASLSDLITKLKAIGLIP